MCRLHQRLRAGWRRQWRKSGMRRNARRYSGVSGKPDRQISERQTLMKTELSILIPTYNDCCLELVRQLAEQAQNIEDLHAYEIIVADDGSTEKETVEANRPINNIEHCRYIERSENRGRAIIRNFLAQQACHAWLLYIDSDMTVIRKDFLKTYLTCAGTQVVYDIRCSAGIKATCVSCTRNGQNGNILQR